MKKLILFFIFTLLLSSFVVAQNDNIDLHFFYGQGCPHCAKAELFLEELDYPEKEFHMREHAHLIEVVLHFKDRFDKGDDILEEFLVFLRDWIDIHLKTTDHEYVKFFQKCGLK